MVLATVAKPARGSRGRKKKSGEKIDGPPDARDIISSPKGNGVASTKNVGDEMPGSPSEPRVTIDRSALEGLPVAIFTTDAAGEIDFFNREAIELWGLRPEIDVSHERGAARGDTRYVLNVKPPPEARLSREGTIRSRENGEVEWHDGHRIPGKSFVVAMRDAAGGIVGALHMQFDRTLERRATIAGHSLAAIVESSNDAIVSGTLDGLVTYWNASATRIFGWTADDMIGQPIARIIPPELHEEETAIIAALRAGERVEHFDTVRVARDGRRVDVSLTISPIRDADGVIIGASNVARDITHRKRAEASERDATRVAERARVAAEAASREKTEFLAVMSHEIRTPMTSIAGFVDLLSQSAGLTPEQRRHIQLVKAANASLLTTVNDILDFSKVEAGRLELDPRPFRVADAVRETLAILQIAAAEKNIVPRYNIDPSVPEWVLGDEARLRQILLNLLNNAIKFTDGGAVSIEVRSRGAVDGRARLYFSVADTGIGIPAWEQHRLFQRFSQADAAFNRRHGGTGLGLAICKRLVELMEGEIGVVSGAGKGATFWFTAVLPEATRPPAVVEAPVRDPFKRKGRILLVDDIDANLEIVGHYLADDGYGVAPCDSAAKAISWLQRESFDLVLMDVQMPVLDGIAATRLIRAMDAPLGQIPIIALTGNVLPQQIKAFLAAGMNDHIGKPIARGELHDKVGAWLSRRGGADPEDASAPMDFNHEKFDEFLRNFGSAWVEEQAGKFARNLEAAFGSTREIARREAHQLLNFAGLIGFDRLVERCRDVESAPRDDPWNEARTLDEARAEQAKALRALHEIILPRTRAQLVVGAFSLRRFGASSRPD